MSNQPALTFGCAFSDRIEAFLDGRVGVPGFDLRVRVVEPQNLFREVLRDAAWDVAELSMASHIAAIGAGRRDYLALPVFLSRSFRHSNLFVRTDRIARPEDLAGRRIGVIDWQQTAGLWLRGILADEHGVDRHSVAWISGGLARSVPEDRVAARVPDGIRLSRTPETLDALIRAGEIDAIISPSAPPCLADPAVPVGRMWPDSAATELDWWRRTGLFPIMHVAVLRRAAADSHPGLAEALTAAFERARQLAAADARTRDFPKLAVPWLSDHALKAHGQLGRDPWTYGLDTNRPVLETMMRYAASDGLSALPLQIEELFC